MPLKSKTIEKNNMSLKFEAYLMFKWEKILKPFSLYILRRYGTPDVIILCMNDNDNFPGI